MKRVAFFILVLLILAIAGVVETVLLSWAIARWNPIGPVELSPPRWSHAEGDGWYYQSTAGRTWEVRRGPPIRARARAAIDFDPNVPAPSGSVFADPPSDQPGHLTVIEVALGWPRPALAYDYDLGMPRPVRGGLELESPPPGSGPAPTTLVGVLPIRPIRGAFLFNATVSSGTTLVLCLLLWIGLRTARRLLRRLRGRCPDCGYIVSRTESATCPECGSAVRTSPRAEATDR